MRSYSEETKQVLSLLSDNERGAFRARKSKYVKRGFPEEEAIQLALRKIQDHSANFGSNQDSPKLINEATNTLVQAADKFDDTVQVLSLKQDTSDASKQAVCAEVYQAIRLMFSGLIVISSTAVLVFSTVQVFGNTWEGWTKAILLDVGIQALVTHHAKNWLELLLTKSAAILLVILSIFCLHAGSKLAEAKGIFQNVSTDSTVTRFDRLADDMQASTAQFSNKDASPRELLKLYEAQKEVLNAGKAARQELTGGSMEELTSSVRLADFGVRLGILFVSLFFTCLMKREVEGLLIKQTC